MSFAPARVARHFVRLVEQLVREDGNRSAVARRLGLSPSYIAKLLRGEGAGHVRQATVEDALARIGLPCDALDSELFLPANWRDYVVEKPIHTGDLGGHPASIGRTAEELDERFDTGDPPSATELRELAQRFLGLFEIALAREVRDAPTDAKAIELGRFLVQALRGYSDR